MNDTIPLRSAPAGRDTWRNRADVVAGCHRVSVLMEAPP
jgi:hypothetical protein